MYRLTVLYGKPTDPAAFDLHYAQVHIPLARQIPGLAAFTAGHCAATDKSEPAYYWVATLDFANEAVRPKLAVSLNASNDLVRESIMPITRKWNIAAILEAIATVPLRPRERVTFEYVLLGGINDQQEHADELIALLKDLRAKINLIVWNSGPDMPFHEPVPQDVAAFQKRLRDAGIPAFIRRPRGRDIYAACGQLKRTLDTPAPLIEIAAAANLSS